MFPLGRTGAPVFPAAYESGEAGPVVSVNGEYFDQDRVTVTAGRMADPDRADEFVATAEAERLLGWHVGQVIPMGLYTSAQAAEPAFGTAKVKPYRRLEMTLTGTVVFNDEVVLDEVDRFPAPVLFTPALIRPLSLPPVSVRYGLKLRAGQRGVPAMEREIIGALPKGTTYGFHVTSVVEGQVDRTVKPEAAVYAQASSCVARGGGGHLQLGHHAAARVADRRGMGAWIRVHADDQISLIGSARCVSSSGAMLERRHRPGGKLPRQSCDESRPLRDRTGS